MDHDNGKPSLNPTSLTVADAARLLTRATGQAVTVAMLEADLAAGAPANADGTINLVHYAAAPRSPKTRLPTLADPRPVS